MTLLTASAANAAANPVQVNTTLEGCRRTAPTAQCTWNANQNQSTYTTGDLGKNWSELDFVPHRLTLQNNGPDQTFTIQLAADNMLNGKLGYDLIKPGWDSTYTTQPRGAFEGSCGNGTTTPSIDSSDTPKNGIVGGVDTTLTRGVTLTMSHGDVCYVNFEVRLGIGSHLYSGSSLQTQVLNGDYTSLGQRTVSIPVKEIAPQVATATASATTNTNYTWGITKTANPASLTINSCAAAPTTPNVGFTVTYTRTEHAGTGLHITGTITMQNPSVRALTTHDITDTVTDSDGSGPYNATITTPQPITVPAATSSGPGVATAAFFVDVPLPVGTLTNTAEVSYDDPDQPGVVLPALDTASTPVPVSVTSTTSNSTADITDTENFTTAANGVQFERTSSPAMSAFDTTDTFHKNGVTGSGNYSISKIVKATTPGNFNVTLRDGVSLLPSDGGTASASDNPATASADVTIHVVADQPTITLTKHVDIAPTASGGATFGFTITSVDHPTSSWTTSITIPQGQTSQTGSPVTVDPSTGGYTISETPAPGYSAAAASISGPVKLCDTVSKDIYDTRDLGHVTVTKVLDGPVAGAADTFAFDVSCPSINFSTTLHVTGAGSASTDNVIPTGTPCTITEQTPPTGWTFESSNPSNGGVISAQTDGSTNTVTITNQRVLGHIRVHKVISGDVAGAPTDFHFNWTCAGGTYHGTLEVVGSGYDQTGDVIPTGVSCTITETDPGADWTSTSSPVDGSATSSTTNSDSNTVTITNTRVLGHITVDKVLSGPIADAGTTFTFNYSCANGAYTGQITVDASTGSGSNSSDDVIPIGVSCTITEADPGSNWSLTETVPSNGGATSATTDGSGNTVTFTNTRNLGSVEVKKVLDGPVAGAEHSFTFSVACASQDGSYSHTFTPSIDPTVDDTWSSGDVIPTGVSCTVTETGDYAHWTLEAVSPDGGVVVAGSDSNLVTVTNLRDYGHVTVVKTLDGDIAGAETSFTFHVACDGVDQSLLPDLVIDASEGTGSASTADVIPTDDPCTVTEVGSYAHWTLESVTPHGEDPTVGTAVAAAVDGSANTVNFTNKRDMGVITVDKTRVGDVAGASTVFVFDIKCAEDPAYNQTLTIDTADSATASATSTPIPTDVVCTVTERTTEGWQLTQVSPDPGDGPPTVTVPGEISFTNTRLTGPLQLNKSVTPTTGSYTAGDPNNTLTYTLTMTEPAPGQLKHTNVVVTDYIPGYDPADTTSGKTTYVDGSATCSTGCIATYDASQHLLTWDVGTYNPGDPAVVLTFKVTIDSPTPAANGAIPAEQIDNVGFVQSLQQQKTPSNQVVVPVTAVLGEKVVKPQPKPSVLPFTGSAVPLRPAALLALFMLCVGAVLTRVRRREDGDE
ncbi:MAG TPA: DUF5979 domain-containing protein [Mycobacteriales bacterium]|nr:DUF5979 domain-containing protein [Mycobacteriales bacterium]